MKQAATPILLSAKGISKRFPGVQALDGVDLDVNSGEILAVVGENGAGKSTLMRILAGAERPDEGTLHIKGRPVSFRGRTPADAIRSGVALIHQELELCDNLDVAGNILLGREPRRGPFVDRHSARKEAFAALEQVGLAIDPSALLEGLGVGQRQLVEIAKALSAQASILIMDEPTSSLTLQESERLFSVMNELRDRGTGIIYISHRLAEVERLADRAIVLRDGVEAGTLTSDEINHDRMVRLMVGRSVTRIYDRTRAEPRESRLRLEGFRTAAHPAHAIDLEVRGGEVVGLAGLVGSGRTELLRSIFGIDSAIDGTLLIDAQSVHVRAPRQAMACGMALVPEDRKADGLFLEDSVRDNIVVAMLRSLSRGGFRSVGRERTVAGRAVEEFQVRTPHDRVAVGGLSGGNQQKVSLARWLARNPSVLLLDEPTRGVDVGAKEEIYALIDQMVARGVAVLFASSEMEEILALSDRVLIMHEGRLAGELQRDELDEESIMHLATGGGAAA